MAGDWIKKNDTEFQAQVNNAVSVINANLAAWGLVAADLTPTTTAQTAFNAALTDQIAKQAAAESATVTKRTRRTALEQALRLLIRRINNHPGMTDGLRAQIGITVPDRVPSRRGVGAEIPGVVLETRPGQVIIHFGTSPGNELTNGKPLWAAGCNLYRRKGNEAAFTLIAFDTASPYVDTVTGAATDVSYKAAYRGVRATDEGGHSAEQTVAAGG